MQLKVKEGTQCKFYITVRKKICLIEFEADQANKYLVFIHFSFGSKSIRVVMCACEYS